MLRCLICIVIHNEASSLLLLLLLLLLLMVAMVDARGHTSGKEVRARPWCPQRPSHRLLQVIQRICMLMMMVMMVVLRRRCRRRS